MRRFFSPNQATHAPVQELHNGAFTDYAEKPSRAQAILDAIGGAEHPEDCGVRPIEAVHDAGYLAFLRDAANL